MFKFLDYLYTETYVPHVKHVLYPILMSAAGWKCIKDYGWEEFGLFMIYSATALMLVIILGIGWRGPIEYWEKIAEAVKALLKAGVQPVEIKSILGLSSNLPEVVTIKEYIKPKTPYSLPGIKYSNVPKDQAAIMHTVANKVILSKSTDFTEELYGNIIKGSYKGGWKKFLALFKEKGYVTKASKHPKSKHVLTHKGIIFMQEIAHQKIIEQVESEE